MVSTDNLMMNVSSISTDEHTLLVRAFREWKNHDSFTDSDVEAVKAIFQRVFPDNTGAMMGSTYRDALVMQPKNDKTVYYAMLIVLKDNDNGTAELQWKKAVVTCTCFEVLNPTCLPFNDFLMIAGHYDDDRE